MSQYKKLWFDQGLYPTEDFEFGDIDDFDYNYDFYDIDTDPPVEGDDEGKFNFGNIDDDEPHATGDYDMNNDPRESQFDFGDQDEDPPVEEEDDGKFNFIGTEDEEKMAEGDWDMNKDIPIEPEPEDTDCNFFDLDEDPPVEGDDDGKFNFGDLNEGQTEGDYNFFDTDEDPPVEGDDDLVFNFSDIDEDPESFEELDWDMEQEGLPINMDDPGDDDTDIVDWDFGEAEDDEEYIYDFYDIEEHPDMRHTQYDIEFDFGDEDRTGYRLTKKFLEDGIRDIWMQILHTKGAKILEVEYDQMADPYIVFQYFYSEKTNKSFIQFNVFNINNHDLYNQVMTMMTWRINSQFKYDTGITAEIVNSRETSIVPDNRLLLTPYTIGYWYSVNGEYEAIEDRAEVYLDLQSIAMPPNAQGSIYDLYKVANEITRKYNVVLDPLDSKANREKFIKEREQLMIEYGKPEYKDIYKEKVDELKEEYIPNRYNNNNVPLAVTEFLEYYMNFFGCKLPSVYNYTKRCKYRLANF